MSTLTKGSERVQQALRYVSALYQGDKLTPMMGTDQFFQKLNSVTTQAGLIGFIHHLPRLIQVNQKKALGKGPDKAKARQDLIDLLNFLSQLADWSRDSKFTASDRQDILHYTATNTWYGLLQAKYHTGDDLTKLLQIEEVACIILAYFAKPDQWSFPSKPSSPKFICVAECIKSIVNYHWRSWQDAPWPKPETPPEIHSLILEALYKTKQLETLINEKFEKIIPAFFEWYRIGRPFQLWQFGKKLTVKERVAHITALKARAEESFFVDEGLPDESLPFECLLRLMKICYFPEATEERISKEKIITAVAKALDVEQSELREKYLEKIFGFSFCDGQHFPDALENFLCRLLHNNDKIIVTPGMFERIQYDTSISKLIEIIYQENNQFALAQ